MVSSNPGCSSAASNSSASSSSCATGTSSTSGGASTLQSGSSSSSSSPVPSCSSSISYPLISHQPCAGSSHQSPYDLRRKSPHQSDSSTISVTNNPAFIVSEASSNSEGNSPGNSNAASSSGTSRMNQVLSSGGGGCSSQWPTAPLVAQDPGGGCPGPERCGSIAGPSASVSATVCSSSSGPCSESSGPSSRSSTPGTPVPTYIAGSPPGHSSCPTDTATLYAATATSALLPARKRPRRCTSVTSDAASGNFIAAHYLQYELPDEVLLTIFSFLKEKDLCHIAQVCKRFQSISNDSKLW